MRRALMVQAITAVLLTPAFADSPAGAFGSVKSAARTEVVNAGLRGAKVDNSVANVGTSAWDGSAAANDRSHAHTDNRVFLLASSLSKAELRSSSTGSVISGNALHMRAASFAAANSAGGTLKNFRGGAQMAQNTAQHGLIQQRLSVDANLKIDH